MAKKKKLTPYQKRMAKSVKSLKFSVKEQVAPKILKVLEEINSAIAIDPGTYKFQKELEDFRLKVAKAYERATHNNDSLIDSAPGLRYLISKVHSLG